MRDRDGIPAVKGEQSTPPLVLHIINRLAIGGLENGLINLINHMPPDRYRHAIVCLTDSTDFRDRLLDKDVPVLALHKRDGHDVGCYLRIWRMLRSLKPAIIHTRNLPTIEYAVIALAAGVTGRIHGEHGRDVYDLDGSTPKYRLLRKALRFVIHHFTAVSKDLSNWLIDSIRVRPDHVSQIYNGVNIEQFHPRIGARVLIGPDGFMKPDHILIGTVGRMQAVKDQVNLVRAFIHLLDQTPQWRDVVRLIIIGDGPLRQESLTLLREAQVDLLAWLPGERADVPEIMRSMDLFILPSRAEGISNTILEAMATGLPVVATHVGGNPELVEVGVTGALVPPADPIALASAIGSYVRQRHLLAEHGHAARIRVETCFSMASMVNGYMAVYDHVLAR
jgi:sugar transferase (PEP-CTERM/EpsH1 system associated)